jgi:hypothetical protein
MNRRRLPWLLSLGLIAVGSVTAHTLGYLAFAGSGERGAEVAESSHGPAAHLPLVLAILAAAIVVGVVSRIVSTVRGRAPGGASARLFFVLPPLGFAVQEAIERFIHVESFPWNGLHEPAFLSAMLLQIPFGVIAYLAARWLTRVAVRLGRMLAGRGPQLPRRAPAAVRPTGTPQPRRYHLTAHDCLQRAPPHRGLIHRPRVVVAS